MSSAGAELAVQGYIELGQWLLDNWGNHYLTIATQIDNGSLTADALLGDVNACGFLSVQSAALIANEAFDAAAVLTGQQDQPVVVTSTSFPTLDSANPLMLGFAGDLIGDFGDDTIPGSAVVFPVNPIPPHAQQFQFIVTATDHHSEGYSGTVQVFDSGQPNQPPIDVVPVWITV
jgi:hypothetical protein